MRRQRRIRSDAIHFQQWLGHCPELRGNVTGNIAATTSFTKDTWHHVVLTYDNTNINVYLDGNTTPAATQAAPGENIYLLNAPMYFGSYICSFYWKGYIDDCILYDRVLSATEISSIYNSY